MRSLSSRMEGGGESGGDRDAEASPHPAFRSAPEAGEATSEPSEVFQPPAFSALSISALSTVSMFSGVTGPTSL